MPAFCLEQGCDPPIAVSAVLAGQADNVRGQGFLTAVTMLAEAGCSNAEIAAITGHSMQHVETILTKYVSLTRALAQSAMAKLENAGSDFSGLV